LTAASPNTPGMLGRADGDVLDFSGFRHGEFDVDPAFDFFCLEPSMDRPAATDFSSVSWLAGIKLVMKLCLARNRVEIVLR